MELGADMTMFNQAIHNWQKKCRHWAAYADRQKEALVKPILVIQVDDGSDHEATKTDLNICIDVLQESLGELCVRERSFTPSMTMALSQRRVSIFVQSRQSELKRQRKSLLSSLK